MFFQAISSSLLLLASSVLVDAAGYATRDPQFPSCHGFNVLSNESVPLESQNLIISTGVVCNVAGTNYSTPCNVLSGGWPEPRNVAFLTNGTQVYDTTSIGYGIWNATGDLHLIYGGFGYAVENQTVTFDNGTSGNVVFTPTYRCITGNIQGCPSDFSLANDTEVRACYPVATDQVVSFESYPGHFENITVLAGNRSINETSVQAAADLKKNPSNYPPYGLSSSAGAAGVDSTAVGVSSALFLVLGWLGIWVL